MPNKKIHRKFPKKGKIQKNRIPNNNPFGHNNGENDKKWFNNVKGLLDSITLPQFLLRKGTPILGDDYPIGVPSVAAIQVLPVLGSDEQLAFTNSVDKLYANLRRANTGAATYTKQDLSKYILNLSIAIVVDRYIRRAYGVCNKYSGVDSTLPIAYFKAMGLDYDSFKENMSNLRSFINNNSIRLHSIIAGKCDLFERRAWMFEHIFRDGQTNKAQEYLFTIPEGLEYYDWINDQIATVVIPLYTSGQVGRTYAQVIGSVDTFMRSITADNKVNYIAADLIKAYGLEQSKDYFTVIPENYVVDGVYNEEVLNEIQNAKLCGSVIANTTINGLGAVSQQPYINTSSTFGSTSKTYNTYLNSNFINYYRNKIDILDYAVATRLSPRMFFDAGDNMTHFKSFGTEIPMYIRFVVTTPSTYLANLVGNGLDAYNMCLTTFDPFAMHVRLGLNMDDFYHALWTYFDWAPMMQECVFGFYDTAGVLSYSTDNLFPSFDFDNFAKLDSDDQLSNIHTACNQSLLYWPDVIKDQRVITLPQ